MWNRGQIFSLLLIMNGCKEIDMSDFSDAVGIDRLLQKCKIVTVTKSRDGAKEEKKEKAKLSLVIVKRKSVLPKSESESESEPEPEPEPEPACESASVLNLNVAATGNKMIRDLCARDADQHQYVVDIAHMPAVQLSIREKIRGYKLQDTKKGKFDADLFIDYDFVLSMLRACASKCFYCRKGVYMLYDRPRDKRQWTIERIDNRRGHNQDNVEIACLQCNLARCTVSSKNYAKTKRLTAIKKTP